MLMSRTNKAFLLGFLLYFLSSPGFAATMPPVRMKFVDAQDDRPVPAAHVLFQGSAQEGTLTGHGGRLANLFVVESVTDDAGEVRLPKQEFSPRPFFLNTNYDNPSMVVLKPGYALVVLTNHLRIIPTLEEMTTWQYDNQTIKMKRATTDNEMPHAVYFAAIYAEQTMSEQNLCSWQKIPRFLVATDRMAAEWDRKRTTLADPALRNRAVTSPLRKILMNDKFFTEKGCGPPKVFFEPYLR